MMILLGLSELNLLNLFYAILREQFAPMPADSLSILPSLISSYSLKGMWSGKSFNEFIGRIDDSSLRGHQVAPDLYLFMEKDVQYWRERFGEADGERRSAIRFLADLDIAQIEEIVASMQENLSSIPPVAITTFLPEISMSYETKRAELIDEAIRSLFLLAIKIGNVFGKTPVVQMVAGSVIERIRSNYSSTRKRDEFYVVRTQENECFKRILDRLSLCFERISEEETLTNDEMVRFDEFRVAFELEPGPLYLLDGAKSLVRFCDFVENHKCPIVRSKVGFNLDVAHWWLKNIRPAFFEQHPKLKNRIFHAHIAGHCSKAHFGDISLAAMSPQEKCSYVELLKVLNELDRSNGYSGYVSLEYEAARNAEAVTESLCELIRMIEEPETYLSSSQVAE
jgi:sugar phosphate isomerase/epimerase